MTLPPFESLRLERPAEHVVHVRLSRPRQLNALNPTLWREVGEAFRGLASDPDCRVVLLSGEGRAFCSGIDLKENGMAELSAGTDDAARKGRALLATLRPMQEAVSAIEQCPKPVLALLHGVCLGGGLSLSTAADLCFAQRRTRFSLREVVLGMTCDVGALARLPKAVGNLSWLRDIALTGRQFDADEALRFGLISRVFDSEAELWAAGLATAAQMAALSPVAVQGTKLNLNFARDHSVREALDFVAAWNMSQLFTDDLALSAASLLAKAETMPKFSKL